VHQKIVTVSVPDEYLYGEEIHTVGYRLASYDIDTRESAV
jgi:hypothetical protein